MQLFGVFGNPILHSLSPAMHNAALEALGLPARYVRVAARDARAALRTADSLGLRGFNVTSPFKEDLARLVPYSDIEAELLQAMNLGLPTGRGWKAYNTDPFGVAGALEAAGCRLEGEAVVLGAGGAGRAAAHALESYGVRVTLANRTLARARRAAARLEATPVALGTPELRAALARARIIVNTAATDDRLISKEDVPRGAFVLEARYGSTTALARDARARGCTVIDGRSWLLHQGREAFRLLTGHEPPAGSMERGLARKPERRGAHLALVGFMGVGKSTVADHLAKRLRLRTLDTDRLVEKQERTAVPKLLLDKGEAALRRAEARAVRALPARTAIVACGGGLVTVPATARLLRTHTRLVVWLWAGPDTCLARIGDPGSRPLLGKTPRAQARRLLDARLAQYAAACDVVVDTEGRKPEDVAEEIAALWQEKT